MRVVFSTKADQDLADLFEYIKDNLQNGIAAHNIVSKILDLSKKLSIFPDMGSSLKAVDIRLAPYRYLIVGNYLLIYRVTHEEVLIIRIVYAKSDYVQTLQG